jgi:seryl-tRNA synthetase
MLDIRLIRSNPELVKAGHRKKGVEAPVDEVLALDAERRRILKHLEDLKAERNRASETVARRKKAGEPADDVIEATRRLGVEIAEWEARLRPVEETLQARLLELPNIPHESVPDGAGEADNPVVAVWGTPRTDPVAPHWEIGEALRLIDFERARKLSGSRFSVLTGFGAELNRALINFMLDEARARGYQEVAPPYLVLEDALVGTGQFPKFREDVFRVVPHELYLIPTAEVPLVNLHRDEILPAEALPINYCAYTACFRSEAGAAGRDTRGLIRQHQFDKVELVKLVEPAAGLVELERMRDDAENILRRLGLPFRTVEHCAGDLGFGHHKSYDLEVWMPSYGRYVEISSVSLMSDFQARRAGIRYRPETTRQPEYVYTLNGSALAVGRTLAAILENYQTGDGRVRIPEALGPYLRGRTVYPDAAPGSE